MAKDMTTNKTKQVSAEEFVRIWQTSTSVKEVCEKTGNTESSVRARADKYKNEKGIPLKRFANKTRTIEVEALKKLAQELAPAGTAA